MADNNATAKKPGIIHRVKRFFKDASGEMKKIVWPNKKQITNNTGIVIVVVIIAAIFVGCLDTITTTLIKLFAGIL